MTLRHTLLLAVLLFALQYRVVTAHRAFSPVYDGSNLTRRIVEQPSPISGWSTRTR